MSAIIKAHWDRVAQLGCMATETPWREDAEGGTRITLHHPHGGSMIERGVVRCFGRKTSDLLVIPLAAVVHIGPGGIDGYPRPSVAAWEKQWGTQAKMLDRVCHELDVDLWALAEAEANGTLRIHKRVYVIHHKVIYEP